MDYKNFQNLLNKLFPFLTFYFLGNRTFTVFRTTLEFDSKTAKTTKNQEYLGELTRYPHSPCWQAYTEKNRQWDWEAPIQYSLPSALRELLKHQGFSMFLNKFSVAECVEFEEKILQSEESNSRRSL